MANQDNTNKPGNQLSTRLGSPSSPNKEVRAATQAALYRARIHRAQRQQGKKFPRHG
jgi:hypothetical protein